MSVQDKIADLLQDDIAAALRESGQDARAAQQLAAQVFTCLRKKWGGNRVYIPTALMLEREARNKAVQETFNGRNHAEICRRYHITPSTLWRIVNDKK